MPRQARLDYPGATHHVMGRGIDGLFVFQGKSDKEDFLRRIKKLQQQSNMQIHAWCVMGNHFHLFYQTGTTPLATFMRGLLTGYALSYNLRHKRRGHLFQNRYKSIVVEADEYFLPLIRYIHLNPVKAKVVPFEELAEYPWSGHREIMQKADQGIIDREEVLGYFGHNEKAALKSYAGYLKEGIGKNEDYLLGGGLIRSAGGWQEVIQRKPDEREMSDERILGSGGFVEEALKRCEQEDQQPFKNVGELLEKVSRWYKVDKGAMVETKGWEVREARSVFIYLAVKYVRISVKEAGEILRIKNAAASMAFKRGREIEKQRRIAQKLMGI